MKILVLADEPSKWLYDFYEKEKLADIDLILSCGDLPASYLSFLVTMTNLPLLYVSGNHDKYDKKPPEGCICVDDDIYEYEGVRIVGLGGSYQYIPGAKNQYTERQMAKRARKLFWKIRRKKGFDILSRDVNLSRKTPKPLILIIKILSLIALSPDALCFCRLNQFFPEVRMCDADDGFCSFPGCLTC